MSTAPAMELRNRSRSPAWRVTFLAAALLSQAAIPEGHQMLGRSLSVTKESKCSDFSNCVNRVCPMDFPRRDVNADNPPLVVRRGQWMPVRILRNNHDFGFARYSLVSLADMQSFAAHSVAAFHYVCADSFQKKCESWNLKRDCPFDAKALYNEHRIKIPTHARDGVYVLGWTWYGSRFVDSRDCTYVYVRGGELTETYQPRFSTHGSKTGGRRKCLSLADRPGQCNKGECKRGGSSKLILRVPWPFRHGARKAAIHQSTLKPHKIRRASVTINWIAVVDADNPRLVKYRVGRWRSSQKAARICVDGFRPAVVCDVSGGAVKRVEFLKDGWRYSYDKAPPYDMEQTNADMRGRGRLMPIKFGYKNAYFTVACHVVAEDGTAAWRSMAISTVDAC